MAVVVVVFSKKAVREVLHRSSCSFPFASRELCVIQFFDVLHGSLVEMSECGDSKIHHTLLQLFR